jgi:hypothetical protein
MKLELGPSVEKKVSVKPHCLFISGATDTDDGIRGIKNKLEEQYGVGRVEAFSSILNFKDPRNPERFEQMANVIQSYSKEGLDIIAHSLGAVELKKAIDVIKKRDQTFFDKKENIENLHIVLISPSGFSKGILGPLVYLGRIMRYAHSQVDLESIKLNSPHRGMDALAAFPPEGISSGDLAIALREAMPELSQLKDDRFAETIPLQREPNYLDKLSSFEKEQVKLYGNMINAAIIDGNYDALRHLVIRYGKLLKKPLNQVSQGYFESTENHIAGEVWAIIGGCLGLLASTEALGSNPMKEFAKLQTKGASVNFIVPEYDIIVPLDEAIEFFDSPKEASTHILVAEGVTHRFPILQKSNSGRMVKEFNGIEEK